jgi:methionine-rich copper-binding protein CopC
MASGIKEKVIFMGRFVQITAFAAMAACAIVSTADARPRMLSATPVAGSTVKEAPKTIRITFSEGVMAPASGIAITREDGQAISSGKTSISGANVRQITIPVTGDLVPGKYNVAWHTVGGDGVRVDGTFSFEVKP